ncbi:MAG: hypothetical protein H7332_17480 [Bdellovibrionales bacterium]|nr:hypothetical protein [Ramlibacter sp.]
MIRFESQPRKGILRLHPEGPIEATDFTLIAGGVDAYLAGHGKLQGVLFHANSLPDCKRGFA